ncbi:MAG: hypothetical protein ACPIA7_08465 [Akkermansiaceae bacterium]
MTTNNQNQDEAPNEGRDASDSGEAGWLNLGHGHDQQATRRHAMASFLKWFARIDKNLSLDRQEKIALLSIAVIFLALSVWASFWLKHKNHLATTIDLVDYSHKGTYASISQFSSYWKKCHNAPGIKMGAVAVPAATITLGKRASSGALRVYFHDHNGAIVGDPVTLSFQDATFSDSHMVEITASDGFHDMVDFETYQLGDLGDWHIEILESKGAMEPKEKFSPLFHSVISPDLSQ